jgi:predicted ATPase
MPNNTYTTEDLPYLREIQLKRNNIESFDEYPFNIPVIQTLDSLIFDPQVTFFIGENGAGKSTLIEAIAVSLGFNPEGGTKTSTFSTRHSHSILHQYLKTIKSFKYPRNWHFLRAESFYNLATLMDETNYYHTYSDKSLHEQSHGESFIATLTKKLKGRGLYIMDEPEAALSPTNQMAALAAIHRLVEKQSQFIIATHSPILLAYPNATIYQFSSSGIEKIPYQKTEHYTVTKDFLNRHQQMLNILLENE